MHIGDLVQRARQQTSELTGLRAETVTGLIRDGDDRWVMTVEALELARVPSTMDVLGTFEVTISIDGELLGPRRLGHRRRARRAGRHSIARRSKRSRALWSLARSWSSAAGRSSVISVRRPSIFSWIRMVTTSTAWSTLARSASGRRSSRRPRPRGSRVRLNPRVGEGAATVDLAGGHGGG